MAVGVSTYRYINVKSPVLGMIKNVPPADISPRHCTDCRNVYFWNGEIRKRFGFPSGALAKKDSWVLTAAYSNNDEITEMFIHDWNYNVSAPQRFLYVIDNRDTFYYDAANNCLVNAEGYMRQDCDNTVLWSAFYYSAAAGKCLIAAMGATKVQGTGSIQIALCALAPTPNPVATIDISASNRDYSDVRRARFWIRMHNKSAAAGDLQIGLIDKGKAKSATGTVPAIDATGVWQWCDIKLSGGAGVPIGQDASYESSLYWRLLQPNANLSSCTFFMDAITFARHTELSAGNIKEYPSIGKTVTADINGSALARPFWTNFTSGHNLRYLNKPHTYGLVDGRMNILSAAADYHDNNRHQCRTFEYYKNHLMLMGLREKHTAMYDKSSFARWSDLNDLDVWDTGTSGDHPLVDSKGNLYNSIVFNDFLYIFQQNSVVRVSHVGGENTVFKWNTIFTKDGLSAPKLLIDVGNYLIWVGNRNVYRMGLGGDIQEIGDPVKDDMFGSAGLEYSDGEHHLRSFWLHVKDYNLIVAMIPTSGSYPDGGWGWDYVNDAWVYWDTGAQNITAGTSYDNLVTTKLDRGLLIGNSSGNVYKLDYTDKVDGSVAIDAKWDSMDFSDPNKERTEYTRWRGIHFEAKGDGITISYSIDSGASWTAQKTLELTSNWARYFVDWNESSHLLRFRFSNNTANEDFRVRWFSLEYEKGTVT